MNRIVHFNVPCDPEGARELPVARRSFTVVVGPGERKQLTAALFIDDTFAASYRFEPRELPRFLHWMGDSCEQANVSLSFAVVGEDEGQGVPLPCPPPSPPPLFEIAGPALQTAFLQLWKATGGLFGRKRDK